jgi:hypothetical protein
MFIVAAFTTAKSWNQPRCPLTDKHRVIMAYSAIKKSEIMSFIGK